MCQMTSWVSGEIRSLARGDSTRSAGPPRPGAPSTRSAAVGNRMFTGDASRALCRGFATLQVAVDAMLGGCSRLPGALTGSRRQGRRAFGLGLGAERCGQSGVHAHPKPCEGRVATARPSVDLGNARAGARRFGSLWPMGRLHRCLEIEPTRQKICLPHQPPIGGLRWMRQHTATRFMTLCRESGARKFGGQADARGQRANSGPAVDSGGRVGGASGIQGAAGFRPWTAAMLRGAFTGAPFGTDADDAGQGAAPVWSAELQRAGLGVYGVDLGEIAGGNVQGRRRLRAGRRSRAVGGRRH